MRTSVAGFRRGIVAGVAVGLLAGCAGPEPGDRSGPSPTPTPTPSDERTGTTGTPAGSASPGPTTPTPTGPLGPATPATPATPTSPAASTTPARPPSFDPAAAFATVRTLAGLGPRETTSRAYRRAAAHVERRLAALGYRVSRQAVDVPAGNSWGIDVPAGVADNLLAVPDGFDADAPHRVVGAHLDTVPQAPGAEDNASGVAVLLELARMAAEAPPEVPVTFVVFAAEEPRGEGDDWHHFGSQHYVRQLDRRERDAVVGMVAVDRVGAGRGVRIRAGDRGPRSVLRQLAAAAGRVGVAHTGGESTASDHWSFQKAGIAAARLGGTAYAGYHNADDVPDGLRRATLDANGRVAWAWLTS